MYRVIVVGLKSDQMAHLRRLVPAGIELRRGSRRRLRHVRSLTADLVVCTGFVKHTLGNRLLRLAGCPVVRVPGGVGAWAREIETRYNEAAQLVVIQ